MIALNHLFYLCIAAGFAISHYAPQYAIQNSFLLTTLTLFSVLLVPKLAYDAIIYPKFLSPLRHLPTPPNASWIWGHGQMILKENTGTPMRNWNNTVPNDGLIRYMSWLNYERLLVVGPKALGEVLVTKNYEFIKPWHVRSGLKRILGVGILLAEGDEHKRQRKELSPAFSFRHIKDLYPVFWDKSVELVERIGSDIQARPAYNAEAGSVIEFASYTSRATLDLIGLAGMGHDFGAIKDPSNTLNQHYKTVFMPPKGARYLAIGGLIFPGWVMNNLPLKRTREVNEARAYIRGLCQELITAKHKEINEKRHGYDILSVALESGGFTDENLIDQMMTFLAAGHETTSTALIWAIYLLSENPQYQTRLREEIHANLASPNTPEGRHINSTQIDALPFLTACINEVLRLWAPVVLTMRTATKDTTIQDQPVPKGTLIVLCPWATNTSYEFWGDDATEFRPERWLTKDGNAGSKGGAESNYSFLTFLHGPRSCIGERFSRSEFACLLAACMGRFEWELETPGAQPPVAGMVTPRPKDGMRVRVRERHDW